MNGSASPECELSMRAVLNWVMRTTGGAKDKHAHFSRNVEGEESGRSEEGSQWCPHH